MCCARDGKTVSLVCFLPISYLVFEAMGILMPMNLQREQIAYLDRVSRVPRMSRMWAYLKTKGETMIFD